MRVINNVFEIGDRVFITTDIEQLPRVVIEYIIRPNDLIIYVVQHSHEPTSEHNDFELSSTRDESMKVLYPDLFDDDLDLD